MHIDSLCIWLFFYIVDQRPIGQNVYIARGFFRGVASCSEDLSRNLGTFIVLFPQPLCRLLNLIFQGSLTRFAIEHNKLVLAMAKSIANFIHIPPVLRVYIKALYDIVNVSKPALDLAGDCGCNTF